MTVFPQGSQSHHWPHSGPGGSGAPSRLGPPRPQGWAHPSLSPWGHSGTLRLEPCQSTGTPPKSQRGFARRHPGCDTCSTAGDATAWRESPPHPLPVALPGTLPASGSCGGDPLRRGAQQDPVCGGTRVVAALASGCLPSCPDCWRCSRRSQPKTRSLVPPLRLAFCRAFSASDMEAAQTPQQRGQILPMARAGCGCPRAPARRQRRGPGQAGGKRKRPPGRKCGGPGALTQPRGSGASRWRQQEGGGRLRGRFLLLGASKPQGRAQAARLRTLVRSSARFRTFVRACARSCLLV